MADAILVVFDFDKTIIDCDSDNWVVDELGLTDLFQRLLPTMPWNTLMDKMMAELHSSGRSVEEIADCLRRAPVIPRAAEAIKTAYALGCELRVVSDANVFFIETILKHHGLLECFTEINTNPSYVDEERRLRIFPHHDFITCSHGCGLCPPNMCKGKVIDRIQASGFTKGKKQFIYLGDGQGDYCPSLRLSEGDYMMPRKNYPCWNLICSNPQLLKPKVHEWSNGEELEKILLQLIRRSITANGISANQFLAVDCQYRSVPVSDRGLPWLLDIPH
ncbi:inorganic pyrophosphatase 2 [Canna indica]|uniref:Inorganic pyrophosphatase 2 n=1 Tax=Canna indica TaxID=4628 RepID=A0AAQ3KMT1_9LILI|nr:inorganic pyrophosphatase 2 [Canna indica]